LEGNEYQYELSYTPAQLEIFFANPEAKFKIIPKGRRLGVTRGASHAFIEWAIEGVSPMLWVDTINGNIERYFERYFLPALRGLDKECVQWDWNQQKKILKINNSIIDFRSADAPESIEGFGYKKIFLNEAGIILKDDYLYSNAILPMMMDYPDSQLFAAGVPKGKVKKDGTKHKFYELWERAETNHVGYWGKKYSSYDNPILTKEDIAAIETEISDKEAAQEIHAEFTESEGTNPFAFNYSATKHESTEAVLSRDRQLFISIDFNLNPFAVNFAHHWRDSTGEHCHVVQERAIPNGSIPAMIDYIKSQFGYWLPTCRLTGDAMGKAGQIGHQDRASLFKQLQYGLSLAPTQVVVSGNPTHAISRNDVNYFLLHFPDYKINPETCPETCRDFKRVQCNTYGEIIKANRKDLNQRADFIDCERYRVNSFWKEWIERSRRTKR
jgi:hypothetical protein